MEFGGDSFRHVGHFGHFVAVGLARLPDSLVARVGWDRIASASVVSKPPEPVLPKQPTHQPLERFWPYAELAELPTEEELAAVHPELRRALFGVAAMPFSITLVFPRFAGQGFERAMALAHTADEFQEVRVDGEVRYRARYFPGEAPLNVRDLYEVIADVANTEVLIDDRPLPYARELWLPLVWCLIK